MAITVEGYGNITKGNAREIYTAWRRGEIELDTSQQKKCESFLTPQEMDEVEYDDTVIANRGKNAIDTENTNDNGNGSEATACGSASAAVASLLLNSKISDISGFTALGAAIVSMVLSAASLVMAFMFDNELKDRKAHSDNAPNDNQTMDGYTEGLAASMDMMNEDVEHYNETQDTLTKTVNTQASQGADLQMQLDTAMAMGDTNKAQQLREQLKAVKESDNSALEDDLAETGEGIEEFRAMNAESIGCKDSGQTVADFLKVGSEKGRIAIASGALCAFGALYAVLAGVKSIIPKIWILGIPTDLPAGVSAAVIWGSVAAVMGTASGVYFNKGSQESECGKNGNEMQEHVKSLDEMIEQQTAYTDDTEGQYAESDEAAGEAKEAASEAAGEAVSGNKDSLLGKPKKEDEPTGAAA